MARVPIGLVGNTFTHLGGGNKGYSVHGKESKKIRWVPYGNSNITFYIDYTLDQAADDNFSDLKFGWLLESKYITPHIVNNVVANHEYYCSIFDTIFTHNQKLIEINPEKFKFVPAQGFWIKEPMVYKKNKLVSMVSSRKSWTDGHRKRIDYIDKNSQFLDLYGRGFNEIQNKEDGILDYMFSIAMENGSYKTYFTEKILDCFAAGTIPVYWGAPDIGDFFEKSGIIGIDEIVPHDLCDDIYYSKIDAIEHNLHAVKKFEVLEDYIYNVYFKERF